jgi:type 1 glutamine amidotransferase
MNKLCVCFVVCGLLFAGAMSISIGTAGGPAKPKKIVLVGMDRDHGPGEHEYMAGLAILEECLKQTPGVQVTVLKVDGKAKGWPANGKPMLDADCIVCFCRTAGTYFIADGERKAKFDEVMKKGAGFVALHWAVETDKKFGSPFMAVLGGYYEPGYSDNPINTATVKQPDPKHPIARGWKPFQAKDEFYFKIRLMPEAKAVATATVSDRKKKEYPNETIGWVYERKDSKGPLGLGRSFGFTPCHYHVNFGDRDFRRLVVNGILWTAGIEIPEKGAPVELKAVVPKVPGK